MSTLFPMTDQEFYQNAAVRIVFELPDEVSNVTYMRRKMRQFVEVLGLSHEDCTAIEIILYELAANAVRHSESGAFKAGIELLGNQAILTVSDNGIGFCPDTIPLPGTMRSGSPCPNKTETGTCERMGGFGLPIVQALADKLEIVPSAARGTVIRVTKNLVPRQSERNHGHP